MAALIKRTWCRRGPAGHKVKHVAHGYTLQVHGKQERKTDSAWSKEAAQAALAARMLERAGRGTWPTSSPRPLRPGSGRPSCSGLRGTGST
jgi:hypothetical protein